MVNQVTKAEVMLLDSSTLQVGTRLNENLIVQENCLKSTLIDCLATEKIKSISAMPNKIGQIKFSVNLTDNFEINLKVIWKPEFIWVPGMSALNHFNWGEEIVLYKSNSELLAIRFEYEGPFHSHFSGTLRIDFRSEEVGYQMSQFIWNQEDINNIKLSVQAGIATLSINNHSFVDNSCGYAGWLDCGKDTLPDSITLNTHEPYTQLVIAGIKEIDRLLAVSLNGAGTMEFEAGRQTCMAHPASCSIEDTHATYNPINGEVYIPVIDVLDSFGNSQSSYEVYLLQQPAGFTFDLDLSRLKEIY